MPKFTLCVRMYVCKYVYLCICMYVCMMYATTSKFHVLATWQYTVFIFIFISYTMGKLSAKYQFCAIHTADNTDGKVTIDRQLTADVHRF